MKKYFLHNGTEQQGPFDLDDLKSRNITRETKIWYDGLLNWVTAKDVDELKSLFSSSPPPLTKQASPPPISDTGVAFTVGKALGKSRWWVTPSIILAIGAVLAILAANSGGRSD